VCSLYCRMMKRQPRLPNTFSKFDSISSRFQVKEVFFKTGNDVMLINHQGVLHVVRIVKIMKGRPLLPIRVTLTWFACLSPTVSKLFNRFILVVIYLRAANILMFWDKWPTKPENFVKYLLIGHFLCLCYLITSLYFVLTAALRICRARVCY